jgi:hypothetical protein
MSLCVSALAVSSVAHGASWSLAVSPHAGSVGFDVPVQYTLTFQHSTSANQFNVVYGLIATALDGSNACFFSYVLNPISPGQPVGFHLVNDLGNDLVVPSSGGVYQNSQCSVRNVTALSSGTTLTLTLWVAFRPAFGGASGGISRANKIIYLAALDLGGLNSGWQPSGTVTVGPPPWTNQQVVSVAPGRSQRQTENFLLTMQDNSGQGFGVGNILINGGLDGNNACWLAYTADGAVILGTDRIDDWLLLGPNPWDSVSNSQCTVWRGTPGDGTRATMAGRTVYLSLKVQFNANWRGGKTIYGALRAPGDISLSGWQAVGTWMQAPSGGNVMTSGLQLGGGAVQQLVMRYRTPFPDDLDRGQINLSGQVDNYQNACQMYWWPSRQLEVAGAGGSFEQGAGDPSICTVAAGTTLTPTVDGYEIAMKVRLSPQLLANFSSSNGDFYVATGATMKSRSGGQPIRTVNPTTPFDGDPDVPEDLFIYNDNQWYFFTGLCFGCNVIGNLNAGAGVSIRCTDPSGGARPPSPDVPREAACGSTILYPSEVQRIYVAMSAPNTTPAGWSAVGISARQVGNDASVVFFSRSIPLQIRAAASGKLPIRMSTFIPWAWIWGPPQEPCVFTVAPTVTRDLSYTGDNRGFSSNSSQARGLTLATADILSGSLSGVLHETGWTSSFAGIPPLNPDGSIAPRAFDGVFGDCFLEHERGKASTAPMSIGGSRSGTNQMLVQVRGAIPNPLPHLFSPTIDWDYQLYLDLNGASPMVSGFYKHDCFPAHELWIGNTQIHGYMPTSNNFATLASCLVGLGQIEGRISARAIPAGQ